MTDPQDAQRLDTVHDIIYIQTMQKLAVDLQFLEEAELATNVWTKLVDAEGSDIGTVVKSDDRQIAAAGQLIQDHIGDAGHRMVQLADREYLQVGATAEDFGHHLVQ